MSFQADEHVNIKVQNILQNFLFKKYKCRKMGYLSILTYLFLEW